MDHHGTSWRNGSASDSRSEGCVFKSRRGQFLFSVCPSTTWSRKWLREIYFFMALTGTCLTEHTCSTGLFYSEIPQCWKTLSFDRSHQDLFSPPFKIVFCIFKSEANWKWGLTQSPFSKLILCLSLQKKNIYKLMYLPPNKEVCQSN